MQTSEAVAALERAYPEGMPMDHRNEVVSLARAGKTAFRLLERGKAGCPVLLDECPGDQQLLADYIKSKGRG